jgi:hypothetical protein
MKPWLRITRTALTAAAIAATACGGSAVGSGNNGSSPCDRFFDAIYVGCMNPAPPASELARVRARFDQVCANNLALAGGSVTASSLDACSHLVATSGCNAVSLGACRFGPGRLPDGSTCLSNEQCMSDTCTAGMQANDGGVSPCGTCVAGSRCGNVVCGPNTLCVMNGASGSCAPIAFGGSGAACDNVQNQCAPSLVCNQATHACAALGAMGSACGTSSDCGGSLVCLPAPQPGTTTCQNPTGAGQTCQSDSDCGPGLGCDSVAHACASVTWASGGAVCGPTMRCLVGSCNPAGNGPNGTCPTVIADGQPCSPNDPSQTCDTESACDGTCQLFGSVACH